MVIGVDFQGDMDLLQLDLAILLRLPLFVGAQPRPPQEHEEQEENRYDGEQLDGGEGSRAARRSKLEAVETLSRAAKVFEPALHTASIPHRLRAGNGEPDGKQRDSGLLATPPLVAYSN
jgi:hypothetical protein